MDGKRFDDLARAMSTRSGRRRAFRALSGGLLAVALVGGGAPAAEARQRGWTCKEFGEHCNNDDACCAGKCSPKHVCHCHYWQEPCGPRKCCSRRPARFARCCPNPPTTP